MSSDELVETAGILFINTTLQKRGKSSEDCNRRRSINLPNEVSQSIRKSLEKRLTSPFCVFLLYGSGGGGHKASVDAVSYLCKVKYPHWKVLALNVSELAGCEFGDRVYNFILQQDLAGVVGVLYSVAQTFGPLLSDKFTGRLKREWKNYPKPNVVVSFVPFLNVSIIESAPYAKHITVMTDFTHTDAHPWLQDQRQTVFCGTSEAYEQALMKGFEKTNIKLLSGMVVHPRFYSEFVSDDKMSLLDYLSVFGFDMSFPTFLIIFGAFPPYESTMRLISFLSLRGATERNIRNDIVELDKAGFGQPFLETMLKTMERVNVLCVCGKNKRLLESIRKKFLKDKGFLVHAVGFTEQIPLLMRMSELIISKPGPGVVAEALVSKKPLLLVAEERNLMEQERAVAAWVRRHGVGKVVSSLESAATVSYEEILHLKENVERLPENRAVFEVGEELDNIAKNEM
ncbi:hypothetical protein GpartN1_g586.t1 [Galdieria partita]|uniref:Glycosyl transferase family 28 C-terminal domain-containing protein n=1 Tax=Galdieria partita TaxID=83374 RepID=A0A9C7PQR4_9RHOD|nr:hypothetical protein GpartN1_g586.t1 [Galdieria partita]